MLYLNNLHILKVRLQLHNVQIDSQTPSNSEGATAPRADEVGYRSIETAPPHRPQQPLQSQKGMAAGLHKAPSQTPIPVREALQTTSQAEISEP